MKEEKWLLEILRRENLPEPSAKLSSTGKTWSVRSRDKKIGKIKHEYVLTQREDLVVALAEQRRSIALVLRVILRPTGECKTGMPSLERDDETPWKAVTDDFFAASDLIQSAMNVTTVQRCVADAMGDGTSTKTLLDRAIRQQQEAWREKIPGSKTERRAWFETRSSVELTGRTHDLVRKQIDDAYTRWKAKQLDERFPMRSKGQPIPLRAESLRLRVTEEGIDLGLAVTGRGWVYFGAQVRGHAHRGLLDVPHRILGSKLRWDDKRRHWILHTTLALKRPPPSTAKGTMSVKVGLRDIVFGLGTDGWVSYFDRSTSSLLHRKQGFEGRRRDKQRLAREPGSGRRGHGRARRYREVARERDQERDFVATWWQQTAALVAKTAVERGYGRVIVQDMSKPLPGSLLDGVQPHLARLLRRFPSAAGRDAVVWACEKSGLDVEVVDEATDAKTCPSCGCSDDLNLKVSTAAFCCIACDLEIPAQMVAGWNSLLRDGADCSKIKRRALATSRATKALRKKGPKT